MRAALHCGGGGIRGNIESTSIVERCLSFTRKTKITEVHAITLNILLDPMATKHNYRPFLLPEYFQYSEENHLKFFQCNVINMIIPYCSMVNKMAYLKSAYFVG